MLNPKKDSIENGFLKPEYPFKQLDHFHVQYMCAKPKHQKYIKNFYLMGNGPTLLNVWITNLLVTFDNRPIIECH